MEDTLTASLIDTNILVYANNEHSPYHTGCKDLVMKAINGSISCAIAFQNLVELYAVITDKRRVEHALTPVKAKELIEFYKNQENIQIIMPTYETLSTLADLIAKYTPTAQSIFDFTLVATMKDNGISEIYTLNVDHFNSFDNIRATNPTAAL